MSVLFQLPTIIALVAALVGVVALLIALVSTSRIKNYLSDSRSSHGFDSDDGDIRSEIIDVLEKSERIKTILYKKSEQPRPVMQTHELSTENFNAIVDTVILAVEERLAKKYEVQESQKTDTETVKNQSNSAQEKNVDETAYIRRYASSYDIKKKTFFKVEDRPSEDTIYEFLVNQEDETSGRFSIYKQAYKKVTECQDFLEGACDVSGSGGSLQIIEKGNITLRDGTWIVDKPLEIKFV